MRPFVVMTCLTLTAFSIGLGQAEEDPAEAGMLRPKAGPQSVVFTDRRCDADGADPNGCVHQRLIDHDAARDILVVRQAYYEGVGHVWIDGKTGRQVRIEGVPHYAPDGPHFVTVQASDHGCCFNGIQVWRMEPDGPVLAWKHSSQPHAHFTVVLWEEADTVRLTVEAMADGEWIDGQPARLTRRGDTWSVERLP